MIMAKKCIICGAAAIYKIKDTFDYYCEECALDNFSDLDLLISVEEEAQKLKVVLEEKMEELEEDLQKISKKCVK